MYTFSLIARIIKFKTAEIYTESQPKDYKETIEKGIKCLRLTFFLFVTIIF